MASWSADFTALLSKARSSARACSRPNATHRKSLLCILARLIHGGFTLLDTQFVTDHLRQFGTIELDRAHFQAELDKALSQDAEFTSLPFEISGEDALKILASRVSRS